MTDMPGRMSTPSPLNATGSDPRQTMSTPELEAASVNAMPQVARASSASDHLNLIAGLIGALGLGGITLYALSAQRHAAPVAETPAPAPIAAPMPQLAPPPAQVVQPSAPAPVMPIQPPAPTVIAPEPSRTPAMVIDNSEPSSPDKADGKPNGAAPAAGNNLLTSDEQFAARISGDSTAKATSLTHPSMVVPQGAMIPAVLETALNSDLPGYARALVSRDVKSFDGTHVLIPRGSRLIGQYKSGLATGVTRAFVIWSRLIRPDGLSVDLGSPATDDLGQAGLSGKVDSHFAKRFGAAILLSIVSGVANSAGSGNSNTIVIGTTSQAQSAATDALGADAKISPTIKVAQGTAIQVFVAHDLDFSQ